MRKKGSSSPSNVSSLESLKEDSVNRRTYLALAQAYIRFDPHHIGLLPSSVPDGSLAIL